MFLKHVLIPCVNDMLVALNPIYSSLTGWCTWYVYSQPRKRYNVKNKIHFNVLKKARKKRNGKF